MGLYNDLMETTYENQIINVEPIIGYVTFRRPDNVLVSIAPSIYTGCYSFEYSNHPNAYPTIIHRDVLASFFAKNPHIAEALDNPDAF